MTRVTLATVAEALGVSTMTVSNAYNRPEKLSRELRERILAKADELGYAGPDATARSLRRGKTGVLGVVLGEALSYAFEDPGAIEFMRGLAVRAPGPAAPRPGERRRGRRGARPRRGRRRVRRLLASRRAPARRRDRCGAGCRSSCRAGPSCPGHPFVAIDERAAAAAAAAAPARARPPPARGAEPAARVRTAATGRWRAAPRHRVTRGRLAGYGVAVGREVAVNDREHGEAAAAACCSTAPSRRRGLLCMSDELAIGALRAAAARGLAVPASCRWSAGTTRPRPRGPTRR